MLTWAMLALACGGGNQHPSEVDQLRVIAIEADLPEAGMGDTVTFDVHVANPEGFEQLDLLVWSCTAWEGSCLETQIGDTRQWLHVEDASDGEVQFVRQVPQVDLDQLQEWLGDDVDVYAEDYVTIQLGALLCEGGSCDVIFDAWDALTYWSRADLAEDVAEQLIDPQPWLSELPMNEVSYAARAYRLSLREASSRNVNPVGEARFAAGLEDAPLEVAAGAILQMPFWAEDPSGETVYAYGYTTVGRFDERRVKDDEGAFFQYFRAPSEPASGEMWMVFDDRDGGLDVWHKEVIIK